MGGTEYVPSPQLPGLYVHIHTAHGHGLAFDSTALTACLPAPEKPVGRHFQSLHPRPSASQASQRLRKGRRNRKPTSQWPVSAPV